MSRNTSRGRGNSFRPASTVYADQQRRPSYYVTDNRGSADDGRSGAPQDVMGAPIVINGEPCCPICRLVVQKRVSGKAGKNYGKSFFSCSRTNTQSGAKCKYFYWEDKALNLAWQERNGGSGGPYFAPPLPPERPSNPAPEHQQDMDYDYGSAVDEVVAEEKPGSAQRWTPPLPKEESQDIRSAAANIPQHATGNTIHISKELSDRLQKLQDGETLIIEQVEALGKQLTEAITLLIYLKANLKDSATSVSSPPSVFS